MNAREPGDNELAWHSYSPASRRRFPIGEPLHLDEGATIKLMAADDVDIPLWETGTGLLFDDIDAFIEFGGRVERAHQIVAWAEKRQASGRSDESDLVAIQLIDDLKRDFQHRYEFVFRP